VRCRDVYSEGERKGEGEEEKDRGGEEEEGKEEEGLFKAKGWGGGGRFILSVSLSPVRSSQWQGLI
jgi:hypothetical protein